MEFSERELRHRKEMLDKIRVMKEFGDFAKKNVYPISDVELEIYESDYINKETGKVDGKQYEEFIVIHYNGGAISVSGANMNSNLANIEEAVKHLDHGEYYHPYYDEIVKDPKWKRFGVSHFDRKKDKGMER